MGEKAQEALKLQFDKRLRLEFHFPPPKYFLFSLLGNAVKSLFIAFSGYFGLSSLFQFLGL